MKGIIFCLGMLLCLTCVGQLDPLPGMDTLRVYTKVETAMTNPKMVKRLDLSRKRLKEIPPEVFLFTELEELILDRNKLQSIPAEITQLKKLRHLSISKNDLEDFPPIICNLRTLERLDLSDNEIGKLPDEIHRLQNLKELILWSNIIGYYPTSLIRMKSLVYVDLLNNEMNDQEQERVVNLLKDAEIKLSPPCDCTFYDEEDE